MTSGARAVGGAGNNLESLFKTAGANVSAIGSA